MRLSSTKQCLFILFLFLSPEVFAQGVFDVLPTDKSFEYLGTIFGGSIGAINLGGAGGNPLLSKMFERLNYIVVTFGVVILSYIGIAGAINTAREGEALGKKFSLWVPLRAMMGMLLMVPTPGTGYSAVQMTVIWFVLNGIGAANTIWGVVLDQLATGTNAVGVSEISVDDQAVNNLLSGVFNSAVCMHMLNASQDFTSKYGKVKINTTIKPVVKGGPPTKPTDITQDAYVTVGVEKKDTGPNYSNICGSFKVTTTIIDDPKGVNAFNNASLLTRLNIKLNALMAMFTVLDPAAQVYGSYKTPPPPATRNITAPSEGYFPQAAQAFKKQLLNLAGGVRNAAGSYTLEDIKAAQAKAAQTGAAAGAAFGPAGAGAGAGIAVAIETWEKSYDKVAIDQGQVNALKKLGWIHAGGYYYALSKTTKTNPDTDATVLPKAAPDDALPPVFISNASFDYSGANAPEGWNQNLYNVLGTKDDRQLLNSNLKDAATYAAKDKTTEGASLPALGAGKVSTGNGFMDAVLTPLSDGMRAPIINAMRKGLTGGADPLLSMGKFGWDLMVTGEAVIFAGLFAAFIASTSASPGACLNPFAYSVNWLLTQMFTLIYILVAMLWGAGATLGIYTPMVPYLIFTSTAVGWFIAVIEAVVAAPFIALALVQPSGEELGNIKQAIGILMNVFLRPVLMIFGFVIAGSLLRATVAMINFGFLAAIEGSVIPSLMGILPILGLYAFFVIAMVNQSFSLIYELPNKVLRYIGFEDRGGYNPKEAAGEAQKGFEKGEGIGAEGMKAGGSKAAGGVQADFEKRWGKKGGGGGGGGVGGGNAPASDSGSTGGASGDKGGTSASSSGADSGSAGGGKGGTGAKPGAKPGASDKGSAGGGDKGGPKPPPKSK